MPNFHTPHHSAAEIHAALTPIFGRRRIFTLDDQLGYELGVDALNVLGANPGAPGDAAVSKSIPLSEVTVAQLKEMFDHLTFIADYDAMRVDSRSVVLAMSALDVPPFENAPSRAQSLLKAQNSRWPSVEMIVLEAERLANSERERVSSAIEVASQDNTFAVIRTCLSNDSLGIDNRTKWSAGIGPERWTVVAPPSIGYERTPSNHTLHSFFKAVEDNAFELCDGLTERNTSLSLVDAAALVISVNPKMLPNIIDEVRGERYLSEPALDTAYSALAREIAHRVEKGRSFPEVVRDWLDSHTQDTKVWVDRHRGELIFEAVDDRWNESLRFDDFDIKPGELDIVDKMVGDYHQAQREALGSTRTAPQVIDR